MTPFDAAVAGGGAPRRAVPDPVTTGPQPAPPAGGQGGLETRILEIDPQVERGTRIVDVGVPAVVRRARRREEAASRPGQDEEQAANPLEETFGAAGELYRRMHRIDRGMVWVLAFCLVAAFLPWTYVRGEGLVSGIESYGALSARATIIAALCVYRRTVRRAVAGLYLVLQLLAVAGILAAPIYWVVGSAEAKMSWGMAATLLGGAAAVALTLARLVRGS